MTGANNDRVNNLAKRFNESQSDYKVNAVYKGSYPEAMAAAIAAYRAGNAPHILQVFEVGTGDDDGGQGRDQAGVRGDGRGRREVRSEGLRAGGRRLLHRTRRDRCCRSRSTARRRCSGTTRTRSRRPGSIRTARRRRGRRWSRRWPSSRRRVTPARSRPAGRRGRSSRASRRGTTSPFLTKENGFAGPDAKLVFNGPVQVRHIENMQDWIKKGYFVYGGRKNEPEAKFYSGECAMMTTSSAAYGTIKQNAKFKFAESTLPYYADVAGRAAEHDHRRREPVGHGRQEEGRVQGRRQVPDVPVAARDPGRSSRRRPATCRSRWRPTS